jgi:chromosome partitioning protein
MTLERAIQKRTARIVVIANEKGGSGKSTITMHIPVALMQAGNAVATIDLDPQQRTLSQYIENRRAWSLAKQQELQVPTHYLIPHEGEDRPRKEALLDAVDQAAQTHTFVLIDTPGSKGELSHLTHSMADTLITPLNDSFVDFNVLGTVDPETYRVVDISHYGKLVEEARRQRSFFTQVPTDWIVLRNRLSVMATRNKRLLTQALEDIAVRLGFRCVPGLTERLIFREFFPRGLTALDELSEAALGTRPTLSHLTARQEVQELIAALVSPGKSGDETARAA